MSARLADLPAISPSRVLELKREASALKVAAGIKQSAALARIAQREGFPSWERLMAKAGGTEVVAQAKLESPTEQAIARSERMAQRRARFGGAT